MDKPRTPPTDLRQAFIQAAREILDEPDTGLDLRKVADRVGKSRTAPYLVFGRTEDGGGLGALRLAAAASGIGDLLVAIDDVLRPRGDPEGALERVGSVYIGFARRHPRLFRLMFGPEVARAMASRSGSVMGHEVREVVQARAQLELRLRVVIEECQRVGAMAAGDSYPLLMGAWAIFHGAAMLLLDGQLEIAGVASSSEQAARFATRFVLENPSFVVAEAAMALAEAQREKGPGAAFASHPIADLPTAPPSALPHEMFDLMSASRDLMEEYGGGDEPQDADPIRLAKLLVQGAALEAPEPIREARPTELDLATVRDVLAGSPALRRARRMHGVLEGSRVLWIDDRPELSSAEQRTLESLGVEVVRAPDTVPALELLGPQRARRGASPFDAIVSDIARPDSRTAGVDALPLLRQLAPDTPVIFYVEKAEPRAYTPPGAFGITNDPDELLHLVLDVLERRRM